MDPMLASVPSIAACALASFLVSDRWVFQPRRSPSNPPKRLQVASPVRE
jgi:putative flippase GtrA